MEDPSEKTQIRSWDEISWSWLKPQDRPLGRLDDEVPGVGFPPWKDPPLKVPRGPAVCFTTTAFLALGTYCELDINDPGLSYTGESQHCSTPLSTPIWLCVMAWVRGSGHGGRVFCKWICSPRKSWWLMIAFFFPSAAGLLNLKKDPERGKNFCYTSKSLSSGELFPHYS